MMKSMRGWFPGRSPRQLGRPVRSRRARVSLEPLESRVVLSTFTVNSLLDTTSPPAGVTTLREAINAADRVTITINAPTIATYIRRLDVLPGDVGDFGVVNAEDLAIERDMCLNLPVVSDTLYVFGDILGLADVLVADYNAVHTRVGTTLPPLP